MDIVKGIRPLDIVLAVLLGGLAAVLAIEDVTYTGGGGQLVHPLDSQSPWLAPVFVLAAVPIIVRRRAVLPALAASIAVLAVSLPVFGWVTRCGFALPLAAAFAYAVARFAPGAGGKVAGIVGVLVLQVVALVMDSSAGIEGLEIGIPLAAVGYGLGALVSFLVRRRSAVPTLTPEHANA